VGNGLAIRHHLQDIKRNTRSIDDIVCVCNSDSIIVFLLVEVLPYY
jgi:hypothetical protein